MSEIIDSKDFIPSVRLVCDSLLNDTYTKENHVLNKDDIPDDIISYLAESNVEIIIMLTLDSNLHIMNKAVVSKGCITSATYSVTEILRIALMTKHCNSIILLHNHPSVSSTKPSNMDIKSFNRIFDAVNMVGLKLIDFLVVNSLEERYSFREERIGEYSKLEKKEEKSA